MTDVAFYHALSRNVKVKAKKKRRRIGALWLNFRLTAGQLLRFVTWPAITHQPPQIADRKTGLFVHPDQERGTDRQAEVTNLAQDRRADFQFARQRCIVLQFQVLNQRVQQTVRIVIQVALRIGGDSSAHGSPFLGRWIGSAAEQ